MSRLSELLIPASLLGTLWLAVLTGLLPACCFGLSDAACWIYVLPFPFYCGIAFGVYALASIAHGVYNVNDDTQAVELLRKDIQRAMEALKEKGFHFQS